MVLCLFRIEVFRIGDDLKLFHLLQLQLISGQFLMVDILIYALKRAKKNALANRNNGIV
jgi:hypothetical protein